jgi:hypothetical protein
MRTPTAALTWELWRRHRSRWILIAATPLAFILVYPWLCAAAGFHSESPDAADDVARLMAPLVGHASLPNLIHILVILFLAGGPTVAMVLTLFCVLWMFTFTELDHKSKDALAFPGRLFFLPVSTSFLFWRLAGGGVAAVLGLCALWTHCVAMPHLEVFSIYGSCFGWMTLLVLGQGIVWALAAWPITRLLALLTVLFLFLVAPVRTDIFNSPVVLPPLFLLGAGLGWLGLQKIRRGQWQGWTWRWPLANGTARAAGRSSKLFGSPAQAQLWFEWRRASAGICLVASGLVLVVLGFLFVRAAAGYPPLDADAMGICALSVILLPLIVFGLHSISPARTDLNFVLTRPLSSGELVMAWLKATAIAAVFLWIVVLAALGVMTLTRLGDFHTWEQRVSPFLGRRVALGIALLFLCWRIVAVNLGFVLTGNRRVSQVPALLMMLPWFGVVGVFVLNEEGVRFDWWWNHLSELAAGLLAVKFLLAYEAFRTVLRRRLLAPVTVAAYLAVWVLLVAALLATTLLLARPAADLMLPAALGVVLLVPLARIGLAPLALAWARHTGKGATSA